MSCVCVCERSPCKTEGTLVLKIASLTTRDQCHLPFQREQFSKWWNIRHGDDRRKTTIGNVGQGSPLSLAAVYKDQTV